MSHVFLANTIASEHARSHINRERFEFFLVSRVLSDHNLVFADLDKVELATEYRREDALDGLELE